MDDEALIRRTAVESIATTNSKENTKLIVPLLYDPRQYVLKLPAGWLKPLINTWPLIKK